jgi:hypothetical protein
MEERRGEEREKEIRKKGELLPGFSKLRAYYNIVQAISVLDKMTSLPTRTQKDR